MALRLRELSVLPPLKANGKVFSTSDNSLLEMGENITGVNTQEQKRSKEDPGKKRKRESAEKIPSTTDNIEVQVTESGVKNGASPGSAISQDMQLMLTVMREGFANLNRTLSNTSIARLMSSLRRLRRLKES